MKYVIKLNVGHCMCKAYYFHHYIQIFIISISDHIEIVLNYVLIITVDCFSLKEVTRTDFREWRWLKCVCVKRDWKLPELVSWHEDGKEDIFDGLVVVSWKERNWERKLMLTIHHIRFSSVMQIQFVQIIISPTFCQKDLNDVYVMRPKS